MGSRPYSRFADDMGANASEGSAGVDGRPQSAHGQRGRPSIAPGGKTTEALN